jgi:hypothetical protein
MAGNSALVIIQRLVAALQSPRLGSGDIFREQFCRGGWFQTSTRKSLKGRAGVEDLAARSSLEYRSYKRADMTRIKCPVYIYGSEFSSIHTIGAVRGCIELRRYHMTTNESDDALTKSGTSSTL